MIIKDLTREQKISYSEIKSLVTCSYAHDLKYNERLSAVGATAEALRRGTLMHEIMAVYCETRLAIENGGFNDEAHKMGHVAAQMHILNREWADEDKIFKPTLQKLLAFFYEANPFPSDFYRIRSFEQSFGAKLMEDLYYVFSPDLVLENRNGGIYVFDFKTIKQFYSYDALDLDYQLPSYSWGLAQFGIEVTDVAFLIFRHSFPTVRKQATHSDAIKVAYLSPTEERINIVVQDIYEAARIRGVSSPLRNAGSMACANCDMKKWCIQSLHGHDTAPLVGSFYQYKSGDGTMEGVIVNG